ncbi:MAG: ROK family glucokinase [Oscillospiraceae bacterium]|nr:ROK family glucokinase [Oscillospiraceae bacterium]
MKEFVFGVDIGGTTVKLGLFTTDGTLLDKWEIPTRTENGGSAVLPDVARSIEDKLTEKNIAPEQVEGIGVGVPGPVDSDSTVHKCINLGWGVFNVKQRMNELLPAIPNVAAGNDANVATLGELWQGGGKGYDSAVMFTLGTGVGGGVVVDGKIVAGKNGGAGEVGHMTVNPEETVPCNCGKCGCLEQYASANGIVRMAKIMLTECSTPSALRSMDSFTSKDICDLAREGEEMAVSVVDRFGDYLGRAMSFIGCTTDPDVFIIGGGMSRAGAVIIDAITKYYRKYVFHVSANTPIAIAELGNDAGIYGCARMVIG